ncbi:MAG: ABC transporter permease, partial [Opitutaceae bacterium]
MSLWSKFAARFRREKLDAEMSEEMRTHLELLTAENMRGGMNSDDARYAARRSFGGVEQIKERARDERGWMWLEQFGQDVRHGLRALGKNPGFTIVVVLSLALGIGANSAVFSRINDRVLRMLPVTKPGELVLFQWLAGPDGGAPASDGGDNGFDNLDRETGQPTRRLFSQRTFEAFRNGSAALTDVFAVAPVWSANVRVDDQTERVGMTQVVSDNYYTALGISVLLGRTFQPEDHAAGAAPAAVISHRYWRARFASDPAAIGKTIIVNQTPMTIVGVTSSDFRDTISDGEVDITMPLAIAPRIRSDGEELTKPGHWWLRLTGRLKPGATIEQARA